MNTNPFYNALLAIAYIVVLVTTIFLGPSLLGWPQQSIFYPILALAVLVFSVALMAYLFFYEPVILLLDGKREQAVKFFLHTVGIFAGAIIVLVIAAVVVNGM